MRTARLSSKSQIVIPADIRRQLGLQPGDNLQMYVEDQQIVITKESSIDALERLRALAGSLDFSISDEILRSRAEWESRSLEIERLYTNRK